MLPKIYKEFEIIREDKEYTDAVDEKATNYNYMIIIPDDAYNYYYQCANILFMKISDIICQDIGFHYCVNFRVNNITDKTLGIYDYRSNCINIYLCNIINKCININKIYNTNLGYVDDGVKYTIKHIDTISTMIYVITHEFMHSLFYLPGYNEEKEEALIDMNTFNFISKHKKIFDLLIRDSVYYNYPYIETMNFENLYMERFFDCSLFLDSSLVLNDSEYNYTNISKERLIMDLLQRLGIPSSTVYINLIRKNAILSINLDITKNNFQYSNENFEFKLKDNGEYNLEFISLLNSIIYQSLYNNYCFSYNFILEDKNTTKLILSIKLTNQAPIEFS